MKIGDKVKLNYGGGLHEKTGEVFGFFPYSRGVIVKLDVPVDFVGGGCTDIIILPELFVVEYKPFLDQVIFTYRKHGSGDTEQRNVLVTKENDEYIEGHDVDRDGFRRFLKCNIVGGKIFRAGKPQ